jgi:hypothetical protein
MRGLRESYTPEASHLISYSAALDSGKMHFGTAIFEMLYDIVSNTLRSIPCDGFEHALRNTDTQALEPGSKVLKVTAARIVRIGVTTVDKRVSRRLAFIWQAFDDEEEEIIQLAVVTKSDYYGRLTVTTFAEMPTHISLL